MPLLGFTDEILLDRLTFAVIVVVVGR